jgi:hypothetical protein
LARESCDLRPRSQYMLRYLRSKWRRFDFRWVLQVRRWSRCRPRYLTVVRTGIWTLFIVTRGHTARVVVNVTWVDFSWLIQILHVSNHLCRRSRWVWRCWDAISGSECVAISPVSFAKVAMLVWSVVGRSAVKKRYSRGPSKHFTLGEKFCWSINVYILCNNFVLFCWEAIYTSIHLYNMQCKALQILWSVLLGRWGS